MKLPSIGVRDTTPKRHLLWQRARWMLRRMNRGPPGVLNFHFDIFCYIPAPFALFFFPGGSQTPREHLHLSSQGSLRLKRTDIPLLEPFLGCLHQLEVKLPCIGVRDATSDLVVAAQRMFRRINRYETEVHLVSLTFISISLRVTDLLEVMLSCILVRVSLRWSFFPRGMPDPREHLRLSNQGSLRVRTTDIL